MAKFSLEQTRHFVQNAATERNWVANTDEAFRDALAEGLNVNVGRYGYYLCPCRDSNGSRERDRDVVCPCTYATDDITEYGHCFCGLFLSPEFAASGNEPQPIPERRPEELI